MPRKKKHISWIFRVFYLFKLFYRYPAVTLPVLLSVGVWYGYEAQVARPQMVYMGVPETRDWKRPLTWFRVLRNDGFMLGYSDLRGNPLWVSYALRPIPSGASGYKRPTLFGADRRSFNRVTHDDYRQSGYDRGHLAPNYAISHLYGREAQLDTFLMTNIAPQRRNLNQKLWQRLETVEADYFAPLFGEVWVLTGPIFSGSTERLKSAWNVEIPDAFYKIYAVPANSEGQAPKMLAFVMPQQVRGNEALSDYVVSVDHVERLTGLDFFAALPDAVERQVEAGVDTGPWQMQKVARLAARY